MESASLIFFSHLDVLPIFLIQTFYMPTGSEMVQASRFKDDPFSSSLPDTHPSVAVKWANRVGRPSRFSGLRLTPFRIGILLLFFGSFVLIHDSFSESGGSKVSYRGHPNAAS